ncbi:helix-turn-helix domain-containing protein, partial [Caenimonas koreensis]|uniref:helix-turn-helix domain-containing protein n=1 Tax=Caenimonas koreensis TaxID=367474 RepID=UPI0037845BD1
MLNVDLIKKRMRTLGLTGPLLAESCEVSKQAVSDWLEGAVPRPKTLLLLADALQVEVDDLVAVDEDLVPEPVVAYRMRGNRLPTPAAKEAGDEVARHIRQLVPLAGGDTFFTHRRIPEHLLAQDCVEQAAAAARALLKLQPVEAVTHKHLFQLFERVGAQLVPVFWGGNKDGHENAMSVYLPDSCTTWVLFNLECRFDDFSYWLAHELGHAVSLHVLRDDAGEKFAERFAQELLFPKEVARQALKEIRSAPKPMSVVNWYAGRYQVSVVAVVKGADRVAKEAGEPVTGLDKGPFYAAWKRSASNVPSAALELFGTDSPAPLEYVVKSEELFGTPVFRAL